MKLMKSSMMALLLVISFGTNANAKCYKFANTGGDVGVCVSGDGSQSRNKAKKICDDKVGNCGNITSSSSRCHSNKGKCYDENGNASRDAKAN
jgi:hypothetical protein